MTNELLPVRIEYTELFKNEVKRLSKRYRNIKKDVDGFIGSVRTDNFPGDLIPDIGHVVYKARIKNSDNTKGKSGGYRIIYHYQEPDLILLIIIYSKSDQPDVSRTEIVRILQEYYA